MPFTLAHAAAALPLRRVLRGSAVFPLLVIGCFIPDIPYFLPGPLANINAHRMPGLVLFGVPCGWAIFLTWRALLRAPSITLLPERYAALLASTHASTVRWWPGTASILAGAVSHVVWDAFTHRRGFVVHAFPALMHPMMHAGGHALPPYFLLQHISTAVGMLCLALHVRSRLLAARRNPRVPVGISPLRAKVKISIVIALALAAALMVWWTFTGDHALRLTAYNFVCTTVSAATIAVVIYALAWHMYVRTQRPASSMGRRD